MQKKTEGSTITVPVPNHKEIRKRTLLSIVRQSGIAQIRIRIRASLFCTGHGLFEQIGDRK